MKAIFPFDLQYDAQGTGTIDLTEFLSLIANRDKGFLNNEVSQSFQIKLVANRIFIFMHLIR